MQEAEHKFSEAVFTASHAVRGRFQKLKAPSTASVPSRQSIASLRSMKLDLPDFTVTL